MRRVLGWLSLVAAVFLPTVAAAQFLDFEACAAPPCHAGALYAASGVTISPAATQVVAGGTNGLTGPSGGKYLSVAAFPNTVTIALARQPTFVTMRLSRASTSSGAITVAVTALKTGSPVATANVVLSSVNAWSPVSLYVAGGFDSIFLDPAGGASLTFGIDGLQLGGTCFGFADVSPSDSFCNAAEWLANRGITMGCTASEYCPWNDVTRAQMALFMQRLGTAVTPKNFGAACYREGSFQTASVDCAASIGSARTSRSVIVNAACLLFGFNAAKVVGMHIVASTNAGASWSFIDMPKAAKGEANDYVSVASTVLHSASPGIDYRYGIELTHLAGAAGEVLDTYCNLTAQSVDVATTTAPFDAAGVAAVR